MSGRKNSHLREGDKRPADETGTQHSGLKSLRDAQRRKPVSERKELPEKKRFPWEDQKPFRRAGGCEIGSAWGGPGKGIYVGWGSGVTGD